uniref:Ig-like domain-containing protein n=1 Tax=Gopherus agassizii TaxID=38772 RepID=A0A452IQK7_9SAUR
MPCHRLCVTLGQLLTSLDLPPLLGPEDNGPVAFYQLMDPTQQEAGEFMFEFDQDEIFHMNLERKTIWRLPNFGKFTSFEAQRALGNITVLKKNMEIMIRRSNRRQAQNSTVWEGGAPEMTVFPEDHVELGEPNILICFMDNFSPPVLSLTWLKNGTTPSASSPTCSSSRQSNFYDYQVEHGGLPEPFTKHWAQVPIPISETTEALGPAMGIIGIIVGTILIMKMNATGNLQGLL